MSKVIVSPVERWPGSVTLADPLLLPQAAAWNAALRASQALPEDATLVERANVLMPAVYQIVEKWELKNWPAVSAATFPAQPRKAVGELVVWLIREITELTLEAEADPPKAQPEPPTPPLSEKDPAEK